MNRVFGRLRSAFPSKSEHSPALLRRLIHLSHHPLRPPSTSASTSLLLPKVVHLRSYSTILRSYSTTTTNVQDQEQFDLFASLRCYTRRDSDTPYYVIECPSPPPPTLSHSMPTEGNEMKTSASTVMNDTLTSGRVEHLQCESCDFYLVGVHRGDENPVQDVKDLINHLKPELLFLELCASRCSILLKIQNGSKTEPQNMVTRVAFEVALQNGTKVVLGDRPFHITVRRMLECMLAMRIWEFTKLSFYLFVQFMDYGKENKVFKIDDFILQKLDGLKAFPKLLQPALHERDLYMSLVLAEVAREHSSVVAIIGSDHVAGIKNHLQNLSLKDD